MFLKMKVMSKSDADKMLATVELATLACVFFCDFDDVEAALETLLEEDCVFFSCPITGDSYLYFDTWREEPIPNNKKKPTPTPLSIYNHQCNGYYMWMHHI